MRISVPLGLLFFLMCFVHSPEASARSCRNEKRYLGYCKSLAQERGKLRNFKSYCRTRIRNFNRCVRRAKNVQDVQRMRSTGRAREKGKSYSASASGISFAGSAARFNTQRCLPKNAPSVVRLINKMLGLGWGVTVFSGYRPRDYNRKVGGKSKSMHIPCRAADIRVTGASWETVTRFLRANRVGGLGLYCSFWHIDNGRTRNWGGCKKGSRRRGGYRSSTSRSKRRNGSGSNSVQ